MRIKQHKESGLWVSSDGRVLMPPCPNIHRFKHTWTFGSKNTEGYMMVTFRGKAYYVHRLVAEAFIPNPEDYKEVDHYPNRDKTANFVENLRWADRTMQSNNRQICEDSLARYGVRKSEDKRAYDRTYKREYYANNPEYAERQHARNREWHEKQKALGKRQRKCPDGKKRRLTDEEYDALYTKKD